MSPTDARSLATTIGLGAALLVGACGFDPSGFAPANPGLDVDPIDNRDGGIGGLDGGLGSVICQPGTQSCSGNVLRQCNRDGTALINTVCDAGCNAPRAACNACNPYAPPVCTGSTLKTCTPEALWLTKSCTLGCSSNRIDCNTCSDTPHLPKQCRDGNGLRGCHNGQLDVRACRFGCNLGAPVCRCDPNMPPRCEDSLRVRCTGGDIIKSPCTQGCQNGVCCSDEDGDGMTACNGDCDDGNDRAVPGQTEFFEEVRTNQMFDYNCDGQDEREHTDTVHCTDEFCFGTGWIGTTVPDCGETALFLDCPPFGDNLYTSCDPEDAKEQIQRCR